MGRKQRFSLRLLLGLLGVVIVAALSFFRDMRGPQIKLLHDSEYVSSVKDITIELTDSSGIRSLWVGVKKNNTTIPVYDQTFSDRQTQRQEKVSLKAAELGEGSFELEIKATDHSFAGFGLGNKRTLLIPLRHDSIAPGIIIKSSPPYVSRGGTGVVCYTTSEDTPKSGVYVNETFFQGYRQKDGTYVCFFAFPHNIIPTEFMPQIYAEDPAGNVTRDSLPIHRKNRIFKSDTIAISDNFLREATPKLERLTPGMNDKTPLERYLHVNKEVRAANVAQIHAIGQNSDTNMLWRGAFLRLPRAAPRAGYADRRTYTYNGQKIDTQDHLGFDLASLRNADVPAANNGRVVFMDDLGIYGNTILIDHGLGIMSLYSHLNEFKTSLNADVKKGDVIGITGSTGMAFGDHLHFGILVGGIEVTAQEWLDEKWIRDNITSRLNAANYDEFAEIPPSPPPWVKEATDLTMPAPSF